MGFENLTLLELGAGFPEGFGSDPRARLARRARTEGPERAEFFRRRKSSSGSESICSRRREGWNVKSKSASLFTAGSRLERTAASRRV